LYLHLSPRSLHSKDEPIVKVRDLRIQCAVASLLLVLLPAVGSLAQQPTDAPKPPDAAASAPALEFDVVSIKEFKWEGGAFTGSSRWDPNGITAMNVGINLLICMAYNVRPYQVSGIPDWAALTFYQLQARMDDATLDALKKLPKKEAEAVRGRMLQAVLADRFKLKVRHETRQFPAYALVVAKGGPSLHEAAPADPHTDTTATPTIPGGRGSLGMTFEDGALVSTGQAVSLDALASQVGAMVKANVKNETGLKGVYDIKLRFTPDNGFSGFPGASGAPNAAPTIFTALQEQLGLKLESTKESGDAVIVEHVEKPSQN